MINTFTQINQNDYRNLWDKSKKNTIKYSLFFIILCILVKILSKNNIILYINTLKEIDLYLSIMTIICFIFKIKFYKKFLIKNSYTCNDLYRKLKVINFLFYGSIIRILSYTIISRFLAYIDLNVNTQFILKMFTSIFILFLIYYIYINLNKKNIFSKFKNISTLKNKNQIELNYFNDNQIELYKNYKSQNEINTKNQESIKNIQDNYNEINSKEKRVVGKNENKTNINNINNCKLKTENEIDDKYEYAKEDIPICGIYKDRNGKIYINGRKVN